MLVGKSAVLAWSLRKRVYDYPAEVGKHIVFLEEPDVVAASAESIAVASDQVGFWLSSIGGHKIMASAIRSLLSRENNKGNTHDVLLLMNPPICYNAYNLEVSLTGIYSYSIKDSLRIQNWSITPAPDCDLAGGAKDRLLLG